MRSGGAHRGSLERAASGGKRAAVGFAWPPSWPAVGRGPRSRAGGLWCGARAGARADETCRRAPGAGPVSGRSRAARPGGPRLAAGPGSETRRSVAGVLQEGKRLLPPPLSPPPILDALWSIDGETLKRFCNITASAYWRLLLLNDSHVGQVLRIFTKGRMRVRVVESVLLGEGVYVPYLRERLEGLWRRRQLEIIDASNHVLVRMVSWWEESTFRIVDEAVSKIGGWNMYDNVRWAIARKIQGVHYGNCPQLEPVFQALGPFWSKFHVFKVDRRARVYNYEIFSPHMSSYIGPMTEPRSEREIMSILSSMRFRSPRGRAHQT